MHVPQACSFDAEELWWHDGRWRCENCIAWLDGKQTQSLADWLAEHGPLAVCRGALRHVMSKLDRPILIDRELVQEALGDQ